ncbi:hypothetical protein [Aquisalimonas sp. 2447]|uniref:hypothetical protein n=1 Tax=Aquisalimonas sp. 2447 TaxID=2740807 RepID=UPI001C2C1958|nr:hypothetical protein [Aquisalimonas sp. 2447]
MILVVRVIAIVEGDHDCLGAIGRAQRLLNDRRGFGRMHTRQREEPEDDNQQSMERWPSMPHGVRA